MNEAKDSEETKMLSKDGNSFLSQFHKSRGKFSVM